MRCWNDWGCDPNGNGGALKDALAADEFETEFARYLYERSEEARADRVGEKETSEQAAIVARYAGLFTRAQRAALATALEQGEDGDRERLFRLKEACEGGIVSAELGGALRRARERDPRVPGRLRRRAPRASRGPGEARCCRLVRRSRIPRPDHARCVGGLQRRQARADALLPKRSRLISPARPIR